MANEIWNSFEEGNTLYALIWRKSDDKVYDVVAGSNTFEVYVEANIDNYDTVLTNQGDGVGGFSNYYTADFPSDITAGVYRVQIYQQVGGSISADDDIEIAQGEIYWDGTAEIDIFTLDTTIEDDVIGADGDTLESLSDQLDGLISSSFKKTNVYGPGE